MTGRSLLAALRRHLPIRLGPARPAVAWFSDEAALALVVQGADVATFAYCPRQKRRTAHAVSEGASRCFDCGFERKTR